jgi:hypothetical protein
MSQLEKYIINHRDEFDTGEPHPGHFTRFEDLLAAQTVVKQTRSIRPMLLKIAALIVIMITVSVFVFDLATSEIGDWYAGKGKGDQLPPEIREAVQYYDNQADAQIAALHQLAANHPGAGALSASAVKEIQNLDATTDELKQTLATNPGNEQILDAIVRNQRMKETMLNNIIKQITHTKR